jgi:alanine dehydrogenase
MRVGIPKEVKNNEFRVSTTAAGVHALVLAGHTVFVEKSAGIGSAITDAEYEKAGATILDTADEVWAQSEMIIKVKEPIAQEYPRMRRGQILFTYLHLAASRECTDAIIKSGITAVAYETVEVNRTLPLLAPMSEVAGRMSIQVGATALQSPNGGRGVLLGGVPGVAPGKVVILGGGSVGVSAASMAVGLRADVTLLDINLKRLAEIDDIFQGRVKTIASSPYSIEEYVSQADLVIGGVLIPGAAAPKIITREMIRSMRPGSVFVDISIDQGGCAETIRPTDLANPTYVEEGVIHYGVCNMPAQVPRTSTIALSEATLPYILKLADHGIEGAMKKFPELKSALNTYKGKLTNQAISESIKIPYTPADEVLK